MNTPQDKDCCGNNCCGNEQKSEALAPQEESFKDQLARLTADFINYKKRTEKERQEWVLAGEIKVLRKLISFIDDLDRALKSLNAEEGQTRIGLELTQKNFLKALEELGIQEIDCSGSFDPQLHEAVTSSTMEGKESGSIITVFSRGYQLRGTVITCAKVSVAQ